MLFRSESEARESDDVVVVLRGLRRFVPRRGRATWLLWIISHPELVESDEPAQFDGVFAASAHWARGQGEEFGVPVTPLLQATNPRRFTPAAAPADSGASRLFVGSTRTNYGPNRPILKAAIDRGCQPAVYGKGWSGLIDERLIRGDYLPNGKVGKAYRSAGVVLNDHWEAMAREGFLSNRLFDEIESCRH